MYSVTYLCFLAFVGASIWTHTDVFFVWVCKMNTNLCVSVLAGSHDDCMVEQYQYDYVTTTAVEYIAQNMQ